MSEPKMVTPATWEEFRSAGLLWWVNRMLHLFGWAIVVEVPKDETGDGAPISKCYPARVRFRGFGDASEEEGFIKTTEHLRDEMDRLIEEVHE